MNFTTKALTAGLILFAGVAFAEGEATDPTVIARKAVMKTMGMNAKVLGDMAGEKVAFDAIAAEAAKAAIIAASADIAVKFEPQATDPASEAKPEIWTNWDDFVKNATALNATATALDVASLEAIKAGMGGLGGACKTCHTDFRAQN